MKKIPRISESEWVVMKTVWIENPITANRIVEKLADSTSWSPKTIKTLLNRLVQKGAVGYESKGRMYNYYPLIEEDLFKKQESLSFIKRVFGGSITPLIATLVESEDLSRKDIAELKSILEKK